MMQYARDLGQGKVLDARERKTPKSLSFDADLAAKLDVLCRLQRLSECKYHYMGYCPCL